MLDHYIFSVRAAGRAEITVRAGDVHNATGLSSAMPNVCSAIGAAKFEQVAEVTRSRRVGPVLVGNLIRSARGSESGEPSAR